MDNLVWNLWQNARRAALERDSYRCTAEEWDPTPCSDRLNVHHIDPQTEDPYDLDGLLTLCVVHHRLIHKLMEENERSLVARR